jgi:tripartite-type tricarboxylate transporter receptor subunit TctC
MSFSRRRFCTAFAGGALTLGLAGRARAQAPAAVALKVLVVVPPGATMDIVARLVAEKLKLSLGRPVIVDYKVGGTGLAAAGGAPEDYQKTILSERNKWGPIAREAGIKID